jgi:predicted  nucleic acid-binding Zn-ribbon protein
MADPTLKDVLEAITQLDTRVRSVESKVATKADLAKLEAKVESRFATLDSEMGSRFDRVEKRLDDLDRDLNKHMDVHREIEKDITLLKRRPPRTAARAPRRAKR